MPVQLVYLLFRYDLSIFTFISYRDGAGPVGIFCVLHNTLQQLRIDGEVDILTTVRLIQTRQPEVITKMVNGSDKIKCNKDKKNQMNTKLLS